MSQAAPPTAAIVPAGAAPPATLGARPAAQLASTLGAPSGQRLFLHKGRWYYRIARGESMLDVLRFFGKDAWNARNLVTLNPKLPRRVVNGVTVVVPRVGDFLLVPSGWVEFERVPRLRAQARRLSAMARARGVMASKPAAWSGLFGDDEEDDGDDPQAICPPGHLPIFNNDGELEECVPDPDAPAPYCGEGMYYDANLNECISDNYGMPCNNESGYYDKQGNCIQCPPDKPHYNYGAERCEPTEGDCPPGYYWDKNLGGCASDNYGMPCNNESGYYDKDGNCIPCPPDKPHYNYGAERCEAKDGTPGPGPGGGGGKTGGGGGKTGGGGGKTGGDNKTGGGSPGAPGIGSKIIAFIQKPVVIGTALAGAVLVGSAAYAAKQKRRGGANR